MKAGKSDLLGGREGVPNKITKLPYTIRRLLTLEELELVGNPLPIPPEILERTKEPAAILAYYFEEGIKKPINEVKVLVGRTRLGCKTSSSVSCTIPMILTNLRRTVLSSVNGLWAIHLELRTSNLEFI
ncbi:hypothetical protein [Candidatus Amarolinea dominans]|uniref:hypothetical protein n=1 Tax=Candidatus Amarolinea dominans TaxID=3140696 RepID=UPI001D9E7229|nr:hypothetical protein [Anaerolineae bacterium]